MKRILVFIFFVVFFTAISISAFADKVVITSRTYVKNAPNINASIIKLAKTDEEYQFLAETDGWYKIRVNKNTDGYIMKVYCTLIKETEEPSISVADLDLSNLTVSELEELIEKANKQLAAVRAPSPVISTDQNQSKEETLSVSKDETPASEFLYGSNGEEIRINSFIGSSTDVVIPQYIDGIPVTMIGEKAFQKSSIKSVVIPEGVTKIGVSAFDECRQLETVALPSTLENIPDNCFEWCTRLREVSGIEHIKLFGKWCFNECRSLKGILTFDHDTTFRWSSFSDTGFTGIKFMSGNIVVECSAFSNSYLEFCYIDQRCNLTFEDYIFFTEYGSFYDCEKLTTLVIPESIIDFPVTLLYGCKMVTVYTPSGSAAEAFANHNFIPVNTKDYESKVQEFSR